MRSNLKPSRKMVQRVADEVTADMIECLQDETAICVIATARMFGLGEKRLKRYIEFLKAVKSEYGEYHEDDILRYKIKEELSSKGIDPQTIYETVKTVRKTEKSPVSIKEAIELDKKFKGFKEWSK